MRDFFPKKKSEGFYGPSMFPVGVGGERDPDGEMSCSFLMCFLRSKFLQKPFPHVGQVKGFLSLCVCM